MAGRGFVFITLLISAWSVGAVPLRLGLNWKAEPQFGGFYSAQQSGLFKAAGLDVTILEGGSGTPTVQMLSADQVDFAVVSADELILARDRGATDLVAVFASYQTNPQCILTHAERNYKDLAELFADPKGLLLWQAGLPYAQFLKKTLAPMKVRTAPYLGGLAGFQHDPSAAQQGFAGSEPVVAQREKIATKVFLVAEAGYNSYTTVLATKRSRLVQHPEEVQKMVKAVREGWRRYLEDPVPTNQVMHGLNKTIDMDTLKESAKAQVKFIRTVETDKNGLGWMSESRWEILAKQLKEIQLIKTIPVTRELFQNL